MLLLTPVKFTVIINHPNCPLYDATYKSIACNVSMPTIHTSGRGGLEVGRPTVV